MGFFRRKAEPVEVDTTNEENLRIAIESMEELTREVWRSQQVAQRSAQQYPDDLVIREAARTIYTSWLTVRANYINTCIKANYPINEFWKD